MNRLFEYLFGTYRRFIVTLGIIGLTVVLIKPGLLRVACERIMAEIAPVLGPALQLGIVIAVISLMLKAAMGKK